MRVKALGLVNVLSGGQEFIAQRVHRGYRPGADSPPRRRPFSNRERDPKCKIRGGCTIFGVTMLSAISDLGDVTKIS